MAQVHRSVQDYQNWQKQQRALARKQERELAQKRSQVESAKAKAKEDCGCK